LVPIGCLTGRISHTVTEVVGVFVRFRAPLHTYHKVKQQISDEVKS
jgi:hypothetical protein